MFEIPDNLSYKDSWNIEKKESGIKDFFTGAIKSIDKIADSNIGKMVYNYFSEKKEEEKEPVQVDAHEQVEAHGRLLSTTGSQRVVTVDYQKYLPALALLLGIPAIIYLVKKI